MRYERYVGLYPKIAEILVCCLLVAFLLLVGGYVAGKRDVRSSIEAKIERQNNEATDKALGAVLNAGRVWTFGTSKCEGSR
jgi:hypothetical protein